MKAFTSRYLGRIPVGLWIRRSIGKTTTYRVRRGNGFYGSILGETIQDRFAYNVSDPNADHVGVVNKIWFAAAVAAWQALSSSDKAWWNKEAKRLRLWMSGYNLFIREHERIEVYMYVVNPSVAVDFGVADFPNVGAWQANGIDLSGVVPVGAKAVHLRYIVESDVIDEGFRLRANGTTHIYNNLSLISQVAVIRQECNGIVAIDNDRLLDYYRQSVDITRTDVLILGWFI